MEPKGNVKDAVDLLAGLVAFFSGCSDASVMRHITIESVSVSSFKCYIGVVLDFPVEPGLFHLTGRNRVEPRLGSNGVGKSGLFDAICWCFFGTSVRGERASDVQTWGTDEPPQVIVIITVDTLPHVIDRTGSPNRLLLDSVEVGQDTINQLLGRSRERFLHSVLFGQSVPGQNVDLFIDLSVPERGALMDEVMQFGKWAELSRIAGSKATTVRQSIAELQRLVAYYNGQKSSELTRSQELRAASRQWVTEQATRFQSIDNDIDKTNNEFVHLTRRLSQHNAIPMPDLDGWQRVHDDTNRQIINLRHDISHIDKATAFLAFEVLATDRVCPTCRQYVSEEYDLVTRERLNSDAARMRQDVLSLETTLSNARLQLQSARDQIAEHTRQQNHLNITLIAVHTRLQTLQENRVQLHQDNPYTAHAHAARNAVSAASVAIADTENQLTIATQQLTEYEYWEGAFKRVRLFLIRRTLVLLEVETANAAAMLGIGHWKITFRTEAETKSGTIRPGIHIEAMNRTGQGNYKSFSGGESQRVRLAVSMGLAGLIQSLSGVVYTTEVWDEPMSWLSPEGMEDLIQCLHQRSELTGKSIWLLDHQPLNYPFDQVWEVTKEADGSVIERK